MGRSFKNRPSPPAPAAADSERRRVGTVVHDERGNASVHWRDAPAGEAREVLEVLGSAPPAVKSDEVFDPYARGGARAKPQERSQRTDLHKLSEHIKLMRELKQRQRGGGD